MFHYPVIRTEFCGKLNEALELWAQFTHVIFTSQTTVEYWPGPWDKKAIAIGDATASALKQRGVQPLVAPFSTQEGVVELIRNIKGYFFIPRSKQARSFLTDFLKEQKIPFYTLDLYSTLFQRLEPVPILDDFDEIVFTSPSTVQGFLLIYGNLPKEKKLTAIGPITEAALKKVEKDMASRL
jgi:uroporphyrinogen-III synthase